MATEEASSAQETTQGHEPVIETDPTPTTPAVVPPPGGGFFQSRITRFLQRVMEGAPTRPVEIPVEVYDRIDGVEVQVAGIEEMLLKRLEEGEGRTLHLVEKRLEVLQEEVGGVARKAAEQAVREEMQVLRRRVVAMGGLAIGLAGFALLKALAIL